MNKNTTLKRSGCLYVVATPIGNLEDITLRALRVLRECDYILCEDTRVSGRLFAHHDIKKSLKRYDSHASESVHNRIVEDIKNGRKVALVSDAGTPGISDPGVRLVTRVRQAGVRVEAIPGPSALTTALSVAGLTGNQFSFMGFVPQKKGRQTFFKSLLTESHPVVFFESTHRILKTLKSLCDLEVDMVVYLFRELTKMHEEVWVGTPKELLLKLESEPVKQKGEFVIIVEGVEA